MKRLFLLSAILLLLINNPLTAQTKNFIDTTKLWSIVVLPYLQVNDYYGFYHRINRDSININDTLYNTVQKSLEKEHVNWTDYGYIREDENGDVFYRIDQDSKEGIIYSMNLIKGDSIEVAFRMNDKLYFRNLEVIDIDTVILSNKSLKRIDFGYEKWIESIGALSGLLYTYTGIVGGDSYELVCYFENDFNIYHNDQIVGIRISDCFAEDIPPFVPGSSHYDIYEVFPNPAKNLINIHSRDEPVHKVEIYNISGRKILEKHHENRISVQSLKSGMYYIRINERIVRQFVIE
jgi:hypothetical protein